MESSFFFFNDRLEQRDLRTYKSDLHQIFRVGRHVGIDVRFGIGFAIAQGTLPQQPILATKSAEIAETPSFLGLAFHSRWQETLNKFAPNSHRRRVWSFTRMSLNTRSNVKGLDL